MTNNDPNAPADTRLMGIVHEALRRDLRRVGDDVNGGFAFLVANAQREGIRGTARRIGEGIITVLPIVRALEYAVVDAGRQQRHAARHGHGCGLRGNT